MWRSFSRRQVSLWIKSGRSEVRVQRAVSKAAIISTFSKSAASRFWNAEWQSPTSRSVASVPTITPISSPPAAKEPTAAATSTPSHCCDLWSMSRFSPESDVV